jgi:hypothetical protein
VRRQEGPRQTYMDAPFAKLSFREDMQARIAPVHSDFFCETSSLSLMGSADRRLNRLHALKVPRLPRALPTTV